MWVGGGDGGAYVQCSVDSLRNVNRCGIWNDFTGEGEFADYRLIKENRAAPDAELRVSFPDFGGLIYLQNGQILRRL